MGKSGVTWFGFPKRVVTAKEGIWDAQRLPRARGMVCACGKAHRVT